MIIPGDSHNTRHIKEMLENLPSIYHENALQSESPLGAILLLIRQNFSRVENLIDSLDHYFDIYSTPDGSATKENRKTPDFLSWLGSWIASDIDSRWPVSQKRFALRMACKLYQIRGVPRALVYKLGFTFGIEVDIIEWTWPQGMQIGVRGAIGVDTRLHERPDLRHCFVVKWQPPPDLTGDPLLTKIRLIRDMIDRERPAHTRCFFWVARSTRTTPPKGAS